MKPPFRDRAEMLITNKLPTGKKILLISDGKGLYAFPGGGINSGETPKEAAIREALEEAGARIKHVEDPSFIYKRAGISSGYKRDGVVYAGSCTHFFIAEFDETDPTPKQARETFVCEWLDPLDAIRVICNNNWRYDGSVIQPILERALA